MNNKSIIFILFLFFAFACPAVSLAQSSAAPIPKLEVNYPSLPPFAANPPTSPVGENVLPSYVVYMFGFIIVVSAVLAVVMIAIGGVEYIYSAGSPEKMRSGKEKIITSVLGLVILGTSYTLLELINPNIKKITEPDVTQVVTDFGYGVWACKKRIDFETMWTQYHELKNAFDNLSINNIAGQVAEKKKKYSEYAGIRNLMAQNCYHATTSGPMPKGYEESIEFIYLVPEEGKRAFGAIIYDDRTKKSRARVIYGDGESEKLVLDKPAEWPIEDKKAAYLRPFALIGNPPTDWYARLYQMPRMNRGASEAKKVECSTHGKVEAWCDISTLALTPMTAEAPPSSESSSESESSSSSSSSESKPPKISSAEFKGDQFIVFFKDDVDEWYFEEAVDIIGPGSYNNLAAGEYLMGEWNEECKEKKAEEPNNESYYPCAKKAIMVSAVFL